MSSVPRKLSRTSPARRLVAVGVSGRSGAARWAVGSIANRVRPACATPLTVVNSPPTQSCVPVVVMSRGPSLPTMPPFVVGNQCWIVGTFSPVVESASSR